MHVLRVTGVKTVIHPGLAKKLEQLSLLESEAEAEADINGGEETGHSSAEGPFDKVEDNPVGDMDYTLNMEDIPAIQGGRKMDCGGGAQELVPNVMLEVSSNMTRTLPDSVTLGVPQPDSALESGSDVEEEGDHYLSVVILKARLPTLPENLGQSYNKFGLARFDLLSSHDYDLPRCHILDTFQIADTDNFKFKKGLRRWMKDVWQIKKAHIQDIRLIETKHSHHIYLCLLHEKTPWYATSKLPKYNSGITSKRMERPEYYDPLF